MGRLFRIFKGVCWLGAQKRSEKIFKFFSPSFYMIIPLIPNHLIFTTWDTSIVVAPSKRNILTQTRVDIGSTQLRSSYETIMFQLCIIFFPPVRSEPTFGENLPENEHSRVRTARVEKLLSIRSTLLFHIWAVPIYKGGAAGEDPAF